MVREIEFKGLSEETSKWLFGNLVKIGNYYHILNQKEKEEPSHLNRVFEDSIREFIGFYDMDNNKIFEKDVVEVYLPKEKPFRAQVIWNTVSASFYFKSYSFKELTKGREVAESTDFYFSIIDAKRFLKVINNDTKENS